MKFLFFIIISLSWAQAIAQNNLNHWETIVHETAIWKYVLGNNEPDSSWRLPNFDDNNWSQGMGSIGFGDNDDSTVVEQTNSVYLRIAFNVIDRAKIEAAVLHADYDDAFIAYLNGVEIARANIGVKGDFQPYNATLPYYREAHVYKGGMPENFLLLKNLLDTCLVNNQNVLAIQLHNDGLDSGDMTGRFHFSVGINDNSFTYSATPEWFQNPVQLTTSNLPIVVLTTANEIPIVDDPRVVANLKIIHDPTKSVNHLTDLAKVYDGLITIELRGSSSQTRFPKKSYAFETQTPDGNNNNVSLLGMPPENDWILYGPYSDKSLMRNTIIYYLANKMGQYAPHSQACEVVLNGKYEGLYLLMEKIKRDKNRLNIATLLPNDNEGAELTGGYIIKVDKKTGNGGDGWYSPYLPVSNPDKPIFFQYDYPNVNNITSAQQNYIQQYVYDFETALIGEQFADSVLGYRAYMDVKSFIDFFLANEIGYNVDGYRISTFLHKHKVTDGGLLHMGPVWDFNLSMGNGYDCNVQNQYGFMYQFHDSCPTSSYQIPFWWARLLEDETYAQELGCAWKDYRSRFLHTDSLMAFIDEQVTLLHEAQNRNFVRWPILPIKVWPNTFEATSYFEEIDLMKQWLLNRLTWLDENLPDADCSLLANFEGENLHTVLYPNPSQNDLLYEYYVPLDSWVSLALIDIQGRLVRPIITEEVQAAGNYQKYINTDGLAKGVYFLRLKAVNEVKVDRLIKIID